MSPPPPWTCRLRAVVVPALVRAPGRRAGAFAVVDYADTPVGPYREAFAAVALGPRSGWVPWMVVDSAAARTGGREHWGLPKELAIVDGAVDGARDAAAGEGFDPARAHVLAEGIDVRLLARVAPGRGVAVDVTAQLRQPRRSPAPVRFTGRVRPALVALDGAPPQGVRPGRLPGLALDGELRIGAPHR